VPSTFRSDIFAKLGVHSKLEAVAIANAPGLIRV
jgi:DNA-binding CsgD family transcriptional regulator